MKKQCFHPHRVLVRHEDGDASMQCRACGTLLPMTEEFKEVVTRKKSADGRPNWQKRDVWNENVVKTTESIG